MEEELLSLIHSGKGSYELIEYVNDVNREHTEVLMEYNMNGESLAAYSYGNQRLSVDKKNFTGYYLYDGRGSVTGLQDAYSVIKAGYQYDPFGNVTAGKPKYSNIYAYNGESYNGNLQKQYLRARYYDTVNGNFISEDSYLGEMKEPVTLNRYKYGNGNPVNYQDPSGHKPLPLKIIFARTVSQALCETAAILNLKTSDLEALKVLPTRVTTVLNVSPIPYVVANINGITYYIVPKQKPNKGTGDVEKHIKDNGISINNISKYPSQVAFLNSILYGSIETYLNTGIPWQVTMAQAAMETGYGSKTPIDIYTGKDSNNLFGIKYNGNGDFVSAWTKEEIKPSDLTYWKNEQAKWALNGESLKIESTLKNGNLIISVIQPFQVFGSPDDSIVGHAQTLSNPVYSQAAQYKSDPYKYLATIAPIYAKDSSYYNTGSWIITTFLNWDGK